MSLEKQSVLSLGAVIAGILLFLCIGLQLFRKPVENPPVTAEVQAPPEVRQILRSSCYDCHSNETRLLWFDRIGPAYWLVRHDVREGRRHLNFSEIGSKPLAAQRGALFESVNQIQLGAMPPANYTLVHHDAVVTPAQLAVLRAYLNPPVTSANAPATPPNTEAADVQYQHWLQAAPPVTVQPAPNGIPFPADYKNWHAVASSERFDNNSMREILGNPVAIQAIAQHHINPWPDGTMFAKVAWQQQPDASGVVHAGQFIQVEFMIRDSTKYAATKGWGWARWRGTDLKPYGANAHFTRECVSCHTPVAKNDYVFTEPIERQNGGQ